MVVRRASLAGVAAVMCVLATALTGCGEPSVDPMPANIAAPERNEDRLQRQAADALTRWAAVVSVAAPHRPFVPTHGFPGWPEADAPKGPEPEPEPGDDSLKLAILTPAVVLPDDAPGTAQIRWVDGTVRPVPTISAKRALDRQMAVNPRDCRECRPLAVTGARLTTEEMVTSHGIATVPVWEFTLAGTTRVLRVGAYDVPDDESAEPPAWDSANPPAGLSIEVASMLAGGRELIVGFTGSPGTGAAACGEDYTARAVESDTAVVVIIDEHPYAGPDDAVPDGSVQACPMMGAFRTATVVLADPLGDRAVLEVRQGVPVPVTR